MKNKKTTALWAFLLWSIWAQRFYLNHYWIGIIYFIIFVSFPPVWFWIWLLEFFYFLLISKETFNKLYNKNLKQCEDCLEYINSKAKKCKYCWWNIFKDI